MLNLSSNLENLNEKRTNKPNGPFVLFLELLTRFELVTSSLPRMHSTD